MHSIGQHSRIYELIGASLAKAGMAPSKLKSPDQLFFAVRNDQDQAVLKMAVKNAALKVRWAVKMIGSEVCAYGVLVHLAKQMSVKPGRNILSA